jgi:hypothetical protein
LHQQAQIAIGLRPRRQARHGIKRAVTPPEALIRSSVVPALIGVVAAICNVLPEAMTSLPLTISLSRAVEVISKSEVDRC